ncbi:hypothetical protein FALBO_4018 [Fusarium albosuccineum]|uniref:Uncharacterized protein n=1 Tax=Fusarium albosuccineum TaxID=1237068 RepID=A0A8H4LGP3_9HYPO|nr:hypothetical protein FALBO_4018 [Fusarium albosuccineum]
MDFINKAKDAVTGDKSKTKDAKQGESQDYVDKGVAFASQKAGFNITPDQQEKGTDAARALYEKQTGSKVDPKVSQ